MRSQLRTLTTLPAVNTEMEAGWAPRARPEVLWKRKLSFPCPEFEPWTILLPYLDKEDGSQGSEMADTGSESRAMTRFGISSVVTSGSATERHVWFLPINSPVHVPRTPESVKTTSTGYCFIYSLFLISLSFSAFLFHSFVTYS